MKTDLNEIDSIELGKSPISMELKEWYYGDLWKKILDDWLEKIITTPIKLGNSITSHKNGSLGSVKYQVSFIRYSERLMSLYEVISLILLDPVSKPK